MPLIDLTGQRFGRLKVLRRVATRADRQARWLCACDCGAHHEARGQELRSGRVVSCGCWKRDGGHARKWPLHVDLAGQKIGRLTVIRASSRDRGFWECLCDCGRTTSIVTASLRRPHKTLSCGCILRDGAHLPARTLPPELAIDAAQQVMRIGERTTVRLSRVIELLEKSGYKVEKR